MAQLKILNPPTQKPVSLEEVKDYLRLDGTAEDNLLNSLIDASTVAIENHIGQKIMAQDWVQYLDGWPKNAKPMWWDGTRELAISELYGGSPEIQLLIGPLISVNEFNTYADDGVPILFAPQNYIVDTVGPYGRIVLPLGGVWPTTILRQVNGIEIKFTAGIAQDPHQVPEPLKQGVLAMVAYLYEHRGDEVQVSMPREVGLMIANYRFVELGWNGY